VPIALLAAAQAAIASPRKAARGGTKTKPKAKKRR
jgi:hypothetical protein